MVAGSGLHADLRVSCIDWFHPSDSVVVKRKAINVASFWLDQVEKYGKTSSELWDMIAMHIECKREGSNMY